jgi:hypothetical protein
MSSLPLNSFKQLLSLGPKFVPYQRHDPTNNSLISNYESFTRLIKLKVFFRDRDDNTDDESWRNELRLPSTWTPSLHQKQFKSFNEDLNCMNNVFYAAIKNLPPPITRNSKILKQIKSIKRIDTIRITNADKNLGFCILDNKHYNQLCLSHLENPLHYQLLPDNPSIHLLSINKNLDALLLDRFIQPKERQYLTHQKLTHKIPNFYVLPKVHKPGPLQGRPLTGAFNAPTTGISKLLRPYLTSTIANIQQKYILKNTMALIDKLSNIRLDTTKALPSLITFDIKSLYPNIQLGKFKELLIRYDQPTTAFQLKLLDFIQTNQAVCFQEKTYHQLLGIPMGDNCSVDIANLYLHDYLDILIVSRIPPTDLILYGRYIDDGFAISYNPDAFIETIKEILTDSELSLSESSISTKTVHFLDIWVTISNDRIITSIYTKDMNRFLYLPFSTAHPMHIKTGWITGELIRIQRYSTLRINYNISKRLFYDRLLARCYPRKFLDIVFARCSFTSFATKDLNPSIYLTLPYSLRNLNSIKSTIATFSTTFKNHTGFPLTTSWTVGRNLTSYLFNASTVEQLKDDHA